jgi:hypothetical protein
LHKRTALLGGLVASVLAAAAVMVIAAPDAYRTAMSEGRRLEGKGDHAGAIEAFTKALAAHPDDAEALSELGWAAFQAHDLDRAHTATEQAIAAAKDPKVKAGALGNLGRIAEEEGDKAAAADAYTKSLALRPNPTVKARLAALGTSPPAAAPSPTPAPVKGDAWSPRALTGPIASIEEWCRRQPKSEPCLTVDEAKPTSASPFKPAAPLLGGRWVVTGNSEEKTARLALQTAAGWFVSAPAGDPGLFVRPVELVTRAGTPPLVAARVVTTWNASNNPEGNGRWQLHCQENLLMCGVGPSGTPSCTPAIPARDGECEDPEKPFDWSYSLDVNVRPDGQLEITAPKGAKLTANARRAVGKHPLPLP